MVLLALWAVVPLLLVGCAGAVPSPTPAPTPTPVPAVPTIQVDPSLEQGRSLFISKGCSTCHGENLEFLLVVNLPEVSPTAIMQQVRKPTGMMRAFPPSEISDEDLEAIARFVAAVLTQRGAKAR